MATTPGILTDWPWTPLGSFKYVILAPEFIYSIYQFVVKDETERNSTSLVIIPLLLWRMLHNQIWISISRHRTAKGNARIVDKGIEFDQVDRERNWDDQILLNGVLFYLVSHLTMKASNLPVWRTDGVVTAFLLHAGPVEFLYYWLHRALHHHFLYSRYHSHHHSSIVTEPITSVIHPFAEHLAYFLLFAIPMLTVLFNGTASLAVYVLYISYIDFMNNMGHCNFEIIPNRLFALFPPLKYLLYTPSFHSLHHTQFRTNYSLFMPFYDYIYGTLDRSSDSLHQQSLKREEEVADVVHLTHLTTPESIYHLRLGFSELASRPHTSTWYLRFLSPITMGSTLLTWLYGCTFVLERNRFENLKMQTWAIPKFNVQYFLEWQKQSVNSLIEEAILEAEQKGCKVMTLGLLNQGEELNMYGGLYVQRNPKLKIRVVDGSSLAVAVLLNSIPKFAKQVLLRGRLTKVAYALSYSLCQRGIQVAVLHEEEYRKLNKSFNAKFESNPVLSKGYSQNIWLVGDGLTKEEQLKAPKGTTFIPFSQLPPKIIRKDCFYHCTPAMVAPTSVHNVHSCENWLPRRVMSAWRIGGVVHAIEGWTDHECGYTMSNVDRVWNAALRHGFEPLITPTPCESRSEILWAKLEMLRSESPSSSTSAVRSFPTLVSGFTQKPTSLSWPSSSFPNLSVSVDAIKPPSLSTQYRKSFIQAAWTRRSRGEAAKRPNRKSWKQRTDMYMRPFVLDVFFSRRFIHAKVMHRGTFKVVSAASTNSKDLRYSLPSPTDDNACRIIGNLIAERCKEADVFVISYEPPNNGRIEGKIGIVIDTIKDNDIIFV